MTQAFLRNPTLLRQWSAREPRLRFLASILTQTIHLSFIADAETVDVYLSFASAELKRLQAGKKPNFSCGCTRDEHVAALQKVLEQLPRMH